MRVIRRYRSAYSGWLEILDDEGQRVLDTAQANYSYGLLQQILEEGIVAARLDGVKNILLLGLGGGSVVHSLRKRFAYDGSITAVEIDPVVIEIARDEFGLAADANLVIVEADAERFAEQHTGCYELILVDLFIHTDVPQAFTEFPFWHNLYRLLNRSGKIIFNAAVGKGSTRRLLHLQEVMADHFRFRVLEQVGGANTLLIAERK
jgi:spermidine synthase